jgi:hypothetical protein
MPSRIDRTKKLRALEDIEAGLKQLTIGLRGLAREVAAGKLGDEAKPRRKVTPALRLQGRYMGLIRTLPPRKKREVMAIRASSGVREAIRAARQLRA